MNILQLEKKYGKPDFIQRRLGSDWRIFWFKHAVQYNTSSRRLYNLKYSGDYRVLYQEHAEAEYVEFREPETISQAYFKYVSSELEKAIYD